MRDKVYKVLKAKWKEILLDAERHSRGTGLLTHKVQFSPQRKTKLDSMAHTIHNLIY